jgi:hypothetical protein
MQCCYKNVLFLLTVPWCVHSHCELFMSVSFLALCTWHKSLQGGKTNFDSQLQRCQSIVPGLVLSRIMGRWGQETLPEDSKVWSECGRWLRLCQKWVTGNSKCEQNVSHKTEFPPPQVVSMVRKDSMAAGARWGGSCSPHGSQEGGRGQRKGLGTRYDLDVTPPVTHFL